MLPIDAKLKEVIIQNSKSTTVDASILLYPKQKENILSNRAIEEWTEPNALIYEAKQPYPGKLHEVVSDRIEQGYHIVTLRLFPFQYHPNKKELTYSNFDLTLEYQSINSSEVQTAEGQTLYRHELMAQSVRSLVRNPQDVAIFGSNVTNVYEGKRFVKSNSKLHKGLKRTIKKAPSALDEVIPDYLIITNQALKSSFERLADWKSKKGMYTIIVTVEEIASRYSGIDLADKIRNYLSSAKGWWGDGLFVLLGGGMEIVPSRLVDGEIDDLFYPTDAYFKNVSNDKSWVFPDYQSKFWINFPLDLSIGRLPFKSSIEVEHYTDKLINYEKSIVENRNYYKNNLYGSAFHEKNSGIFKRCGHYIIDTIVKKCNSPSYINHKYIFDQHDYADPKLFDTVDWLPGDIELNHDNMINLMNNGGLGVGKFHFIYLSDHGSANNMGTSSIVKNENMNKFEVDELSNGNYSQILFAAQCNTADFSKDCFGEHYLKSRNGGGVAYIGNTDVGYYQEMETQLRNYLHMIYSDNHRLKHIGLICNQLFRNPDTKCNNIRLHLLGDPEMPIWTNEPRSLSVRVSNSSGGNSILLGSEHTIQVEISNLPALQKARVCVRKGTEIYETKELGNGKFAIPVVARTVGKVEVTVTAQDYIPYETTLIVSAINSPNINISNIILDDDQEGDSKGNGDGQNNAGEIIEMKMTFANSGLSKSNAFTSTITQNPSFITLVNSSISLPALSPGEETTGVFVYKVGKINEDLPINKNPYFEVSINDGDSTKTQRFKLENYKSSLEHHFRFLTPVEYGKWVDIEIEIANISDYPIYDLKLSMLKSSPIDTTDSTVHSITEIPQHGKVTRQFRFKLVASEVSTNTFMASIKIGGITLPCQTNLIKINDVHGIITTQSQEQYISLSAPESESKDITEYWFYRSTSLEGPYERLNERALLFPFHKDYTAKPFTTYYYKYSVSIRKSESNLSQAVTASTTHPTFAQFPIQMNATNGMASSGINTIDTDGDGKKELFSAMRYTVNTNENFGKLIGLNYDGTELYNIDGNTTTNFGFADFNERLEATPAIADLSNNGTMQVICMTRSTTNNTSSLKCYSTMDEDNDKMPDLIGSWGGINDIFRGPIVSNFDNSIDGTEEVIGYSTGGNIYSFSIDPTQKSIKLDWNINPTNSKWAAGAYSIGDVDGDGNKELVYVHDNDHIYIISSNGNIKNTIQSTGRFYDGSIVLADLNKDGIDEIISTIALTKDGSQNRHIVVYSYSSGSYSRYGNWNESSTQQISDMSGIGTLECSVGDIDSDGQLEVVARGNLCIKVWSHDGVLKRTISTDCKNTEKVVPILADVDGDSEAEIIILSGCSPKVYAYKMSTGGQSKGFPIEIANSSTYSTPCVSDVDGDGYNELIVAVDENVYAWKTLGRSDRIEWGSERHDHRNSGRYYSTNPQTIESTVNWTFGRDVLCTYHIKSGGQLNITSSQINLLDQAKIVIENGGTLTLDGGSLLFADIEVQSGGKLVLKNNAKIALSRKGEMKVLHGGSFENHSGQVVPYYLNF